MSWTITRLKYLSFNCYLLLLSGWQIISGFKLHLLKLFCYHLQLSSSTISLNKKEMKTVVKARILLPCNSLVNLKGALNWTNNRRVEIHQRKVVAKTAWWCIAIFSPIKSSPTTLPGQNHKSTQTNPNTLKQLWRIFGL